MEGNDNRENSKDLSLLNSENKRSLDKSSLVGLTKSKELDLTELKIENVPFIPKGIRKLKLDRCKLIRDFTPLQELKEIEELGLMGTQISDLSLIPRGVRKLNLGACPLIKEFVWLQELEKIEELDLRCTAISNLSSIPRGLKNFVLLSCRFIVDFKPLQELKEIEELDLSCTKINDLSLIPRGVRKLELYCCKSIKDFTPLQDLKEIEELDLRGTNIEDLSFLPKSIKILALDFNKVLCCPDWLKDRIRTNDKILCFRNVSDDLATEQYKRLLELPSTTQPANINSPSEEPNSTEASTSSAGLASIPSSALEDTAIGNAIGAWAAKSK